MKVAEFITEDIIGTLYFPNLEVLVDQHAMDRVGERHVPPEEVDKFLKIVARNLNRLSHFAPRESFWLYSGQQKISLGCARMSNWKGNERLRLNTVLNHRPWESDKTPIINI